MDILTFLKVIQNRTQIDAPQFLPRNKRKCLFVCFSRTNKTNSFVPFLGESMARPNCFQFYLTFKENSPASSQAILLLTYITHLRSSPSSYIRLYDVGTCAKRASRTLCKSNCYCYWKTNQQLSFKAGIQYFYCRAFVSFIFKILAADAMPLHTSAIQRRHTKMMNVVAFFNHQRLASSNVQQGTQFLIAFRTHVKLFRLCNRQDKCEKCAHIDAFLLLHKKLISN